MAVGSRTYTTLLNIYFSLPLALSSFFHFFVLLFFVWYKCCRFFSVNLHYIPGLKNLRLQPGEGSFCGKIQEASWRSNQKFLQWWWVLVDWAVGGWGGGLQWMESGGCSGKIENALTQTRASTGIGNYESILSRNYLRNKYRLTWTK